MKEEEGVGMRGGRYGRIGWCRYGGEGIHISLELGLKPAAQAKVQER